MAETGNGARGATLKDLSAMRTELNARLNAIEKATELQHEDFVRVPTVVDRAIASLRELLEKTIETKTCTLRGEFLEKIGAVFGAGSEDGEHVTLKAYLMDTINERDRKYEQRFSSTDKVISDLGQSIKEALNTALTSTKEALDKATDNTRAALTTANENIKVALAAIDTRFTAINNQLVDQIGQLRSLHGERFDSIGTELSERDKRYDQKFIGIDTQFEERDKRTEQLSLADKTAIAAALQAQKEAAGAQNESNSAANFKMEANFTRLIEQGREMLQTMKESLDSQIGDLKSRLDRGEGRNNVMDPTMAEAMRDLTRLRISEGRNVGHSQGMSWAAALAAGVLGAVASGFVIAGVIVAFLHQAPPQVIIPH